MHGKRKTFRLVIITFVKIFTKLFNGRVFLKKNKRITLKTRNFSSNGQ